MNKVMMISMVVSLCLALSIDDLAQSTSFFKDDSCISIKKRKDIDKFRSDFITATFGPGGIPKEASVRLLAGRSINFTHSNLLEIKYLELMYSTTMVLGNECAGQISPPSTVGYHFVPKNRKGKRAILQQGHANDPLSGSFDALTKELLSSGFDVLILVMPGFDNYNSARKHECFWQANVSSTTGGSPLRYFLEPLAIGVSYMLGQGNSNETDKEIYLLGLSGGGVLSTVYAALDVRIKRSMSVASGLMPFYLYGTMMGSASNPGEDGCYSSPYIYMTNPQISAQELYVLASTGKGRSNSQVWIPNDWGNSNSKFFFDNSKEVHSGCTPYSGIDNPHKPKSLTYHKASLILMKGVRKKIGRKSFEIYLDHSLDSADPCGCHLVSPEVVDRFILQIERHKN